MPIKHISIRPDRDGVIGEGVFSKRWRDLRAEHPDYDNPEENFPHILWGIIGDRPRQRDATVAASFIQ